MLTVLKSVGFVVGFAACALILAFIDFERHYDAWNPNADRVARAVETRGATAARSTSLPYAFADAARAGLPGVESAARVQPLRAMLERGRDRFNETVFFAEPSLLEIFPVTIVAGNPRALEEPNALLISERAAHKYFGDDDPLGKRLSIGGARDVVVAAVMKNWRPDSHIRPDFLLSLETFFSIAERSGGVRKAAITGWSDCHCYVTYLLFDSPAAMTRAAARVGRVLTAAQGAAYAARFPITLQPLRNVYLGSAGYASYIDHAQKGDPTELTVFGAAALLLLLVSALCFANFSTAEATLRARELAVRKMLGARPREIVARLTGRAAGSALVSAAAGLALALPLARWFGAFADRPIDAGSVLHPALLLVLAGIALAVGTISGLMPGLVAARIDAPALLRGRFGGGPFGFTRGTLSRGLVATQFVACFVLIVFALAIRSELAYVREQARLGFDPNGLLVLNAEGSNPVHGEVERRLSALPGVRSVAIANSVPTTPLTNRVRVVREGADDEAAAPLYLNAVDFGYLKTLGVPILAGRDFDPDFGADRLALARYSPAPTSSAAAPSGGDPPVVDAIVNAAAARELGFASPRDALDRELRFADAFPFALRIVGVAGDVRRSGPREVAAPVLYLARTDWNVNLHQPSYLVVRTDAREGSLAGKIAGVWDVLVPGFVASVERMNDRIARQTEYEHRQLRLVALFTAATVALSVFGVLGFATLVMLREARSLAVRRVFGARRKEIALLVSSEQLRLVAAAAFVGAPLAWWLAARWLDAFVVRPSVSAAWFLTAAVAIAVLSFVALFALTWRRARCRGGPRP